MRIQPEPQPVPAPVRYREAVVASPLTRSQKHFLLTLAKWLDWKTLSAFPAQATIAEKMTCSVRSVQRYISQLESIGVLRVLRSAGRTVITCIVLIDRIEAMAPKPNPQRTDTPTDNGDKSSRDGDRVSPMIDRLSSTTRHDDAQTHQLTSHEKPLPQDVADVANLVGWSKDRVLQHPHATAVRLRYIILEAPSAKKPTGFAYKCLTEGWHVAADSKAEKPLRRERIAIAWRVFLALEPREQHERVVMLSDWKRRDLSLPSNQALHRLANWEYFKDSRPDGTNRERP